jgi:hypothetical protein
MKIISQLIQMTLSTFLGLNSNCINIGSFAKCSHCLSMMFVEENVVLGENDNHSDFYFGMRQFEQIEGYSNQAHN